MLTEKLLDTDVGCVAGPRAGSLSCVLASAKRYGLLSFLATIPVWPNAVNLVMNVVDFIYWRMGPHGTAWWLPMVSETGSDKPQRLLWAAGLVTTGLGTSCSCFVYAELVTSQIVELGSPEEVLRLHRWLAGSTHVVALGLALLGFFRWHDAGVDQLEWNSVHICCAGMALLALHPHAKAARDLYDLAKARGAPFMEDRALQWILRVRRYWAHVLVLLGVLGAIVMVWLPRPAPHRFPFDPRTHPVAFCEYVWIFAMYTHFGAFFVDCLAAAKTWSAPEDLRLTLPRGARGRTVSSLSKPFIFLHRASVTLVLVCLLCWWIPFMCLLWIVILWCPPSGRLDLEFCV
mmetsp:Transcript_23683/g.55247  ORF Transcript_23683/g.55247 Transcript_23683/m.55247 type:complete len:346 (+) Transcript_23683:213-1250(+)